MNVTLTVKERLVAMAILPNESDWTTRKVVRDMVSKIGFSAEDREKFQFTQVEGERPGQQMTTWNNKIDQDTEFDLAGGEISMIVEGLEKLSAEKKLTAEHDSLCEKFLDSAGDVPAKT